jgi:hypothetical protein
MFEGYSSNESPRGGDHSFYSGRDDWERGQHSTKDDSCNSEMPIEVQADLVNGVASMSVDPKPNEGYNSPSHKISGKVSGLDSYMGSSEDVGSFNDVSDGDRMSMQDCLLSKGVRVKVLTERRSLGRGVGGAAKGSTSLAQGSNDGTPAVPTEESPAKRTRFSMVQQNTLTGPHGEARQVQ